MSLETSYEVLELLRDDGVQTFRAKEKATGRGLELHLFPPFGRPDNRTLYDRLKNLPLDARRRFLEMDVDGSTPYVVTDPLPSDRTFKAWAEDLIAGPKKPSLRTTQPMFTDIPATPEDGVQILQAGQWRTGTPIPDSLVSKPIAKPIAPLMLAADDITTVMRNPFLDIPATPIDASQPGEFTSLFRASPPVDQPQVGHEFTGLFQAQTAAAPPPQTLQTPPLPSPAPLAQEGGEFTRMFQSVPEAPPAAPQQTFKRDPEPPGSTEFTKFFENPLKPSATSAPPPIFEPPPPPPPPSSKRSGEFTDIFGQKPQATEIPLPPPPSGGFSATGISSADAWSRPQAQPQLGSGPSEYTRMMEASASPSLGQAPFGMAPGPMAAPPVPKKSNLPIFIAIGVAVVLIIAIVVFLVMRGGIPGLPGGATPAAK